MRLAMFASEMEPFIKTGGLGDVIGALPRALAPQLTSIDVFIPLYRRIKHLDLPLGLALDSIQVKIGAKSYKGKVWKFQTDSHTVFFISNYHLFGSRSDLYGRKGKDYKDNLTRFVFFCKAAIAAVCTFSTTYNYDVFHMHDWQTALIGLYTQLTDCFKSKMPLRIFTIHNLAYQGIFPKSLFNLLGINSNYFQAKEIEHWGKINLMKVGILYTDWITTVSRTYAQEIQTETQGAGLTDLIQSQASHLIGIPNGVDYSIWDPRIDLLIAKNYDKTDLSGKYVCKRAIQQAFQLEENPEIPLFAVVSRLDWQKGMDLILQVLPALLQDENQFVLLGTGDRKVEKAFSDLHRRFPKNTGVALTFNNPLAHQIEAGADIFLMPSRYEPSGLNDKYSLKYGTVPIVHSTGGLADSVIDYSKYPETGNGFTFDVYDVQHFKHAITNTLDTFVDKKQWHQIMLRGMEKDFSMAKTANEYLKLYRSQPGHD